MAESRHSSQLDALRACAVGIVMLHHYSDHPFFLSGFGVALFFVLSGFFATRLLLRLKTQIAAHEVTSGLALTRFYVERGLRIFPLYYLILLVTALADLPNAREMLPWNGFFLSNYATLWTGEWPGHFSHFWSLSVLEQFYLVWPLLVLKCSKKWLVPMVGALILLAPLYRLVCLLCDFSSIAWCVVPLASFDQLGCGALLAICYADVNAKAFLDRLLFFGGKICGPIFALLLAAKMAHINVPGSGVYVSLVASCFFIWLVHRAFSGIGGMVGQILNNRVLARIGLMSYSIYLLHTFTEVLLPKPAIFQEIMATDWRACLLIPGTIMFACLTWRFIEIPLRTFRKALLTPLPISAPAVRLRNASREDLA